MKLEPPRARYSPYCGSLVRVMDHDCPFLGVTIGEGNHRAFLLLLLSSFASILGGLLFAVANVPRSGPNPRL